MSVDAPAAPQETIKATGDVRMIEVSKIVPSKIALRGVKDQTEEFQNLLNSIRLHGIMNSITVREMPDGTYGLVDGLQRFTCAQRLGMDLVPCRIMAMDDAETLKAQIITNVHRVKQRPAEVAQHLLRILSLDPLLTVNELARQMAQSPQWVEQQLDLNNLLPEAKVAVDNGSLNLSSAYMLSKLPLDRQKDEFENALKEPSLQFVARMREVVKKIRDDKNAGRDSGKIEWKPPVHLRPFAAVETEWKAITTGGESNVLKMLEAEGIKVTEQVKQATARVVAWCLHQDNATKEAAQAEHDRRQKAKAAEKAARDAEKQKQREAKAAEASASKTIFE